MSELRAEPVTEEPSMNIPVPYVWWKWCEFLKAQLKAKQEECDLYSAILDRIGYANVRDPRDLARRALKEGMRDE